MAEFLYPNYNDTLDRGIQQGERLGNSARDARAYRSGGYQGMEDAAASTGDREGATYAQGMRQRARQFQDQETQQAYQRMQTIAPWARNVIKGAVTLANTDPERARSFLQQNQQRFLDFGFSQDQVNNAITQLTSPDPTARQQFAQELDQAFTQHQDPNWSIRGNHIVGVDPASGSYVAGGTLPDNMSAVRYYTPDEVAAAGFAPHTVIYEDANGTPHVAQQPHYESTRGQQYSTLPPGFVLDDGQQ